MDENGAYPRIVRNVPLRGDASGLLGSRQKRIFLLFLAAAGHFLQRPTLRKSLREEAP